LGTGSRNSPWPSMLNVLPIVILIFPSSAI
jgi:hypothetical protein